MKPPATHAASDIPPRNTRSGMLWLILAIVAVALLVQTLRSEAVDLVTWHDGDIAAAVETSPDKDKPVLLYFTATWCGPCKGVKRAIYSRQDAADRIAQLVIPVKVDVSNPQEPHPLAQRYGINGIPAFILVDHEGNVISQAVGSMGRADFFQWLENGVAKYPVTHSPGAL